MRHTLLPLLLLLPLSVAAIAPLAATSFVPMSDSTLVREAQAIAQVRILSVEPSPADGPPSTDYLVQVERQLGGDLPGTALVVRVLGGQRPDGRTLRIWGAPRFVEGDRALLFLDPHPDGTFRIHQFMLGSFRRAELAAGPIAVRDLRETHTATGSEGELELRDWDLFLEWVADRAAGWSREPDYLLRIPASERSSLGSQYGLIYNSSGRPTRWQEFDQGTSVSFRAHNSGQDGLAGGGFSEVQRAINSWNGDPGSRVNYRYAGTTGAGAGFSNFDGVNTVLFNDPNGDIAGSFGCLQGGTVAIGGPWTGSRTHNHRGEVFANIEGGDVVTNDNLACFFAASSNPSKAGEELIAHELGHTLGLGHSCEETNPPCTSPLDNEALMRWLIHDDGRGARFNDDDRAGLAYLYPAEHAVPNAPSLLSATLSGLGAELTWRDNSDREEGFRVYRSQDAGAQTRIAELPADTTSYSDEDLPSGSEFSYRVTSFDGNFESSFSNVATVSTSCDPLATPTGLVVSTTSSSTMQLNWEDEADNETGYQVEYSFANALEFMLGPTTGPDATSAELTGLAESSAYLVRLAAVGEAGCLSAWAQRTAWTPSSATGLPAAPDELLAVPWALGDAGHVTAYVTFSDRSENDLGFHLERRLSTQGSTASFQEVAFLPIDGSTSTPRKTVGGHQPGESYEYRVRAEGVDGFSDYSAVTTLAAPAAGETCTSGSSAACLLGERFRVQARWRNQHGGLVTGGPVATSDLGDRTTTFAFFNPDVVDLIVKVLDGRPLTGDYWVYFGALSDVEYWVTVTDTLTGEIASYYNEPGAFCGNRDINALPGASSGPLALRALDLPASSPQETGSCVADSETLCLRDDRFQITVSWQDQVGAAGSGVGTAVPSTDDSGFFWFFSADNTELAIKILDGTSLNGRFWVYFGALSDVGYEITVTDTVGGTTRSYVNEQGNFCGQRDVEAF